MNFTNLIMTEIKKNYIREVKFGKNCSVIEPVNLFECYIGDNVFIGPFVEIQKSVIIGEGSKISSHSFICEKVEIGKNCFISHGVMFTNDLLRSGKLSNDPKNWLPTKIGDNVSIGSNSIILPVKIASGCVIGAGSVVTKDLMVKGIYAGNPAKFFRSIDEPY